MRRNRNTFEVKPVVEPTGTVLLVDIWHAIGHERKNGKWKMPTPSAMTVQSEVSYCMYQQDLGLLAGFTNAILKVVAPEIVKSYKQLHERLLILPWYKKRATINPSLHHGHSVAYNQATAIHKDTRGPIGDFTLMVCVWAPTSKPSIL